ncbi:mitochondrial carrier [Ascodesmis nigricans]|uniref:Mitochondrial carrier n=1 Tax=Ascodesmis nigricans TaxID=341454 RepID=A0A4S2N7X4_9PEZI|nr:mitochondrial carrier [Ascodesmis nigricans]
MATLRTQTASRPDGGLSQTQLRAEQVPISRELGDVQPIPQADTSGFKKVDTGREPRRWVFFVAGAAGGMTSTFLTSPLDVVKTRLQSDFYKQQIAAKRAAAGGQASSGMLRESIRHFGETFHILGEVHRVEGWRGLFKGLGPNLSGVVPARAINFFTYGNGKRILAERFNNGEESSLVHLGAAAIAGVCTGTATNPIWLVKTRLQLDKERAGAVGKTRQYKNSVDCVRQVVREEGIKGLYRGLTASYLGVVESSLQWVLYERAKTYLQRRKDRIIASGREETAWDGFVQTGGTLGAAGGAKLFAALLTYPHEVVRTRMRLRPMADGKLKYRGLVHCFTTIWREEGMVAMYGGLTPHLLRVVPSAAIMFGMYEAVVRFFGESA